MKGGSAVFTTVVGFKWFNKLLKVELLVNLDKQILGIDEVAHPLGSKLEQRRVSAVPV